MGGHTKMAATAADGGGAKQQQAARQQQKQRAPSVQSMDDGSEPDGPNDGLNSAAATQYDVEHLATFATAPTGQDAAKGGVAAGNGCAGGANAELVTNLNKLNNRQQQQPGQSQSVANSRAALERLFELEKLSGIWTQRMQIELRDDLMLVLDCETNSIVERFHRKRVSRPEAFNHYNDIYHNIIVFTIDQKSATSSSNFKPSSATTPSDKEKRVSDKVSDSDLDEPTNLTDCDSKTTTSGGELHIFQCVSHKAKHLVRDILAWKTRDPHCKTPETKPSEPGDAASSTSNESEMLEKSSGGGGGGSRAAELANKRTKQSAGRASDESRQSARTNKANTNDTTQTTACRFSATSATTSGDPSKSAPADEPSAKPVVTVASSSAASESVPIVNVSVRETVQVFNQIAALREKGSGPVAGNNQSSSAPAPAASGARRPLSSDVSIASSGQTEAARISALSPGGQLYKQRSMRATLAPKLAPGDEQQQQQQQQGSSTSSSELQHNGSGGKQPDNHNGTRSTKVPASAESRDSSAVNRHKGHHKHVGPQRGAEFDVARLASEERNGNSNGSAHTQATTASSSSASSSSGVHRQAVKSTPLANGKEHGAVKGAAGGEPRSARPDHNGHSLHQHSHRRHQHHHHGQHHQQQQHSSSDSSQRSHASPASPASQQSLSQLQLEQVTTNESYVSVLNHCFDDIEKFIIRLQHAYAAMRELQAKRRQSKKSSHQQSALATAGDEPAGHKSHSSSNGQQQQPAGLVAPAPPLKASDLALLSSRARGPNAEDFFEILSKFKLAFNLLAKLKGCIHEPNAPELVHFLFTPLAIIIESARNVAPPVDPTVVGIPYLSKDALDLLSNCCTSKESDLWLSLGPNWTQTIEPSLLKASRLPSSFQPIFSDGWAPVISELELIGLVVPPSQQQHDHYRSSRTICAAPRPLDAPLIEELSPSALVAKRHEHGLASSRFSEPSLKSTSTSGTHLISSASAPGARKAQHKKRLSPTPSSQHYSNGLKTASGAGVYLQEVPADLALPVGPYRVPKLPAGHCEPPLVSGSRRVSDYSAEVYGAPGRFSPPPSNNYMANLALDEASGYPQGYPMNPSDDYTELQDDHLAGPSGGPRHENGGHRHHQRSHHHPNNRELAYDRVGRQSAYADRYSHGDELAQAPLPLGPSAYLGQQQQQQQMFMDEAEREAMLLDLGPSQTAWFHELVARGALIVRVLFTREANNDKELTVKRGEVLEILDDSRKWWKARNIDLQVAYVPHTIVAVLDQYQTLDELLANSSGDMMLAPDDDPALMSSQRYTRRELQPPRPSEEFISNYGFNEPSRNLKAARSAFRYF